MTFTVVPFINETDKKRINSLKNSLGILLQSLRKTVSHELEKHFLKDAEKKAGIEDLQLSIRIFIPKRRTIGDWINGRLYYKIQDYDGLNVKAINDLSFQVLPATKAQGLVGRVFNSKSVGFDFDIQMNHEAKSYQLDAKQKEMTSYCNFAIGAPIFKENSQKLLAIISFDSEVKIQRPKNKQWEEIIRTYCKIIHRNHTLLT